MTSSVDSSIHAVVKRYADAWVANDLRPSSTVITMKSCFTTSAAAPLRALIAERLPAWQS